ncbi:tRNA1(Val) (adenine(37)-N6)-methyltransferase [Nitrobacter winogradskyi]|uniref:tRNA1(Val) A37 N6-methylase TrmN6 n=2 Tax=Nitrobacter winogradskyi TaxID=913 RepID=A0ACC6AHS9_NITWI|nr:tRNA1(Val) A37 N6-methylase TrmN6 [Nitrobacter winogradskyi]GEC14493.1 methyltransferase [Nitrobacter winogradskyi]
MTCAQSDIGEDAFLGGRLRLYQPLSGHRAGHDAMLLAAATPGGPGDRIVDFGAGVGAAGLAVATRIDDIDLVLIERDETLAGLARRNALLNRLAARVCVLDITAEADAFASAGLGPDSADGVLMNPPFNDAVRHRPSPDQGRRAAHVADPSTLDIWTHAARRMLKSGGALSLIWRSDGLAEVLGALGRGFGGIAIRPVHPDPHRPAIRILVRAIKGSRAPLRLCPGLMLSNEMGQPDKEAQEALAGGEALAFAHAGKGGFQ